MTKPGAIRTERMIVRDKQYYLEHAKQKIEYSKKYRLSHIVHCRNRQIQYNRKNGEEFRMWKGIAGPCVKCGNADVRVLDFHHLVPEKKKFNIVATLWFSVGLIELIEELAKCEVFCSNCHRIEEFENGVHKK